MPFHQVRPEQAHFVKGLHFVIRLDIKLPAIFQNQAIRTAENLHCLILQSLSRGNRGQEGQFPEALTSP